MLLISDQCFPVIIAATSANTIGMVYSVSARLRYVDVRTDYQLLRAKQSLHNAAKSLQPLLLRRCASKRTNPDIYVHCRGPWD